MSKAAELAALIANVNKGSSLANKNLLINSEMEVSQRGTSFTTASGYGAYTLDRWMSGHTVTGKFSIAQVADAPTGFKYSLKATSASAYSAGTNEEFIIRQRIEGQNCIPLALGTSSAKTVTLSFWVKSSLTGTFSGAFLNSAEDRCYVFTYAISSADTWEKKEVTVALDTSGTWLTTNGIGLTLYFSLGAGSGLQATAGSWISTKDLTTSGSVNLVGTNAATWFITGVQLEIGEKATAFEHEPFEATLQKCQRYYFRIEGDDIDGGKYATHYRKRSAPGQWYTDTQVISIFDFPVPMRAAPTALEQNGTDSDYDFVYRNTTSTPSGSVISFDAATQYNCSVTQSGHTDNNAQGEAGFQRIRQAAGYLGWSAEL